MHRETKLGIAGASTILLAFAIGLGIASCGGDNYVTPADPPGWVKPDVNNVRYLPQTTPYGEYDCFGYGDSISCVARPAD